MISPTFSLRLIKLAHTLIWAFFATCIFAIPLFAWRQNYGVALVLIVIVLLEVAILMLNRLMCPLTDVARRYTDDRRDNFDIYLPLWLARYNKQIFGAIFIAGVVLTAFRWLSAAR